MTRTFIIISMLLGLFIVSACDDAEDDPAPTFSFSLHDDAAVTVDLSYMDDQAVFSASGDVTYQGFITEMTFEESPAVITAEGVEVLTGSCPTSFEAAPVGEAGSVNINFACEFTNDELSILCDATQVQIAFEVRTSMGTQQLDPVDLDVVCLRDTTFGELLDVVSSGTPASKFCAAELDAAVLGLTYDYIEFGYDADGNTLFSDMFLESTFVFRMVYFHDESGNVTEVISVNPEGEWMATVSYSFSDGLLSSRIIESASGEEDLSCTYSFSEDNTVLNESCPGEYSNEYTWDAVEKTITKYSADVDETTVYSYTGTVESLTWYMNIPFSDTANIVHPITNESTSWVYTYDGQERITEMANANMAYTYFYSCE